MLLLQWCAERARCPVQQYLLSQGQQGWGPNELTIATRLSHHSKCQDALECALESVAKSRDNYQFVSQVGSLQRAWEIAARNNTSPRNNNSWYLPFEQPSSGHFHSTPCVSSYLWFPSHDLLAFTKSTTVTSHLRSEGTNASSSSSSYLYSWCIPYNLLTVTKSPVWRLSSRILKAISYSSDHPKAQKIFYCRNGVLATNNISMASAPHQRCYHPTKGAQLLAPTNCAVLLAPSKRTRNTSSASSYCRSSSPSHDLLSVTKPTPHKTILGNLTTC